MLRTVLFSLSALTLFSGCALTEFAGTYAASGETVWHITADGLNEEIRFDVGNEVTVASSRTSGAKYTITVDGCPVELVVDEWETAAIVPGDECSYDHENGLVIKEIYDSGTLTMSNDSKTGGYYASGSLAVRMQDGSFRGIGNFRINAALIKTSEWVTSSYSSGLRTLDEPFLRTLDAASRE